MRRDSARVLLVDARDRLLLFRFLREPGQPESGTFWLTPGGGIKDGEQTAEAAARELFEELEASTFTEYRWWSATELAETTDWVVPNGLVGLLTDLLAGNRPTEPVRLPWHH